MTATALITLSAVVIFVLGVVHLVYTFVGLKLHPRDAALTARMKEVSPIITTETTMWRAWVGFNASHSLGAMLFGATYIYLATYHPQMLLQSQFLLAQGVVLLTAYLWLGRRYWFRVPFCGIAISTALYCLAIFAASAG